MFLKALCRSLSELQKFLATFDYTSFLQIRIGFRIWYQNKNGQRLSEHIIDSFSRDDYNEPLYHQASGSENFQRNGRNIFERVRCTFEVSPPLAFLASFPSIAFVLVAVAPASSCLLIHQSHPFLQAQPFVIQSLNVACFCAAAQKQALLRWVDFQMGSVSVCESVDDNGLQASQKRTKRSSLWEDQMRDEHVSTSLKESRRVTLQLWRSKRKTLPPSKPIA